MKAISKYEIRRIFKKHSLQLGFPINSTNGEVIVDWYLSYEYTTFANSDLKKFEDLIKTKYRTKYKLVQTPQGNSVAIQRISKANLEERCKDTAT